MEIFEFENRLEEIDHKLNELIFLKKENTHQKNSLDKEVSLLSDEIDTLDKVANLFKHLLDAMLDKKKQDIQKLVTYGLKTVFDDQNLKFHIDIEPKYNSVYTSFRTEQVGVAEGDVLDNFGGGIVNVESFLLRIITLFQTKLSPFLFLDESFSHLSEEYVENCSLLLKSLCEQMGLTVFLITHQPLMLTNANKVYKATSRSNKLILSESKKNG
jgi:DNA repair exonuclease SbcCD ATPase subunit